MECPVCFELFKNPLLLPGCGHTICQSCAELLVTEGNFLRCPECRLVYQLRRGVKSLPKNVALQRTIDEHQKSISGSSLMCESHPDDAVSLYCKTCEKPICLKCYFSNTLRKGESLHSGHQVDTSEDAFSKERRLLEEVCRKAEAWQRDELEYIHQLEESETKIKKLLADKLSSIEKNKSDLITLVKQTSGKLKFTLNGSVVKDTDFVKMSLESSRSRLSVIEQGILEAVSVLNKASNENPEINPLKAARKKLEDLPINTNGERPSPESFSKIEKFDTDIQSCLSDMKMALAYQTESPRAPTLSKNNCVISDTAAFIPVCYNESVRVKRLTLYYKEAMYKGLSEKEWSSIESNEINQGTCKILLTGLKRGTMYKSYAIASNDFGDSSMSNELWFRTVEEDVDVREISSS